jgi:dTDP-4-dehydrorhamnose 3,5-epimerase
MKRTDLAIPGVCLLEPKVFGDERGFFLEYYNRRTFAELGIRAEFVQDNHSRSSRGVLRGLHYQLGAPQAKLVRVIRGEVFDVAVDVRRGSPTFGRWIAERLSESNQRMLYIPEGFAHGFAVVSDVAEFTYKVTDYYAPAEERGILWNDPDLAIPWPVPAAGPLLSPRDQKFGALKTRPPADLPGYP